MSVDPSFPPLTPPTSRQDRSLAPSWSRLKYGSIPVSMWRPPLFTLSDPGVAFCCRTLPNRISDIFSPIDFPSSFYWDCGQPSLRLTLQFLYPPGQGIFSWHHSATHCLRRYAAYFTGPGQVHLPVVVDNALTRPAGIAFKMERHSGFKVSTIPIKQGSTFFLICGIFLKFDFSDTCFDSFRGPCRHI